MPRRRTKLFKVERPEQIAALASPVRQEIVNATIAIGPCSVAELAELLGRAQDSLYYHVRKLVRLGLLVERGERGAGVRREALFDAPSRYMGIAYDPRDKESSARVVASVSAMLRLTQRDLKRALESGHTLGRGKRRRLSAGRLKGWLTASELEEVNRHLDRVREIFVESEPSRGARLQAVTFASTPVPPSPRAPLPGRGS